MSNNLHDAEWKPALGALLRANGWTHGTSPATDPSECAEAELVLGWDRAVEYWNDANGGVHQVWSAEAHAIKYVRTLLWCATRSYVYDFTQHLNAVNHRPAWVLYDSDLLHEWFKHFYQVHHAENPTTIPETAQS